MDRLSEAWGGPSIWIKRDDLTGFGVSGNKIRKLEFHLAAAQDAGADTVITCGAAQSNHCRTTALIGARLGLDVHVVLRTNDGLPPSSVTGNYLLDRLAGATSHFVTPAQYDRRDEVMASLATELERTGHRPWVIPEGASDAIGMWGFVAAMKELQVQLAALPAVAAVWHTASSGGMTAGMGWGADRLGLEAPLIGSSIGETVPDLKARVDAIWEDAVQRYGGDLPTPDLELIDDYVGLGYGQTTREELTLQAEATALTGLVLDPTYTGKALSALRREISAGRFGPEEHVVFWHTGGGFAVFSHDFGDVLGTTA